MHGSTGCRRSPGIHQSMQRGSMARAASTAPMSSVSHPNRSRIPVTCFLAASSLPQMNMEGLPSLKKGLYIRALPTLLNALTKFAFGAACCNCSISEWSRLVLNFNTPFSGGAGAIGLVTSMMVLPSRFFSPAA